MPQGVSVCAGPCNTGWRAAERASKDTGIPHDLTPRYGEPVWCSPCLRSTESALHALPSDAALLLVEIEHGTPAPAPRVSGTRQRPLHPREHLARMIDAIADLVGAWEDDVRYWRQFTPRRPRQQGRLITESSRFLVAHFSWITCEHPFREASVAFCHEVSTVHRSSQRAVHAYDQQPERCVGVRCPGCTWKALVWEVRDGKRTGYVACQQCGRLLTEPEYRLHVRASALKVKVAS